MKAKRWVLELLEEKKTRGVIPIQLKRRKKEGAIEVTVRSSIPSIP